MRSTSFTLACGLLVLTMGMTPARGELVAYYPFDGDLADVSGGEHHGTAGGNPQFVEGRLGQGLEFDGEADFVNLGTWNPTEGTEQFTATMWIFWPGPNGNKQGLIVKNSAWGAATMMWIMEIFNDAENQIRFIREGQPPIFAEGPDSGEWEHRAVACDGTTAVLYKNGIEVGQGDFTYGTGVNAPLILGANLLTSGFKYRGTMDEVRIYNHALSPAEIETDMLGGDSGRASGAEPAGEAVDIPLDTVLRWAPGEYAATHDVYFGTDFDDVNNATVDNPLGVLVSPGQDANTYEPEALDYGTTYYWRVDEVNSPPDRTVYKGSVWSFTTEPLAYQILDVTATASSSLKDSTGAERTVDGSGLTDGRHDTDADTMWQSAAPGLPATITFAFDRAYKLHEMKLWNHNSTNEPFLGLGAQDVLIETAETSDGPWTALADTTFSQAPGTDAAPTTDTIDMFGTVASHVRLTISSNHGGLMPASGLAEVQFFYLPVAAREMAPADGTALDDVDVTLSWRSGRGAAEHEVYLATEADEALVQASDPAVLAMTLPAEGSYAGYTASALDLSQTYVWKVREVGTDGATAYDSAILRFTTPEYIVVDDMEFYADAEFKEIWAFWVDGFDDPQSNGAVVGSGANYLPETDIVHGGNQSLAIQFDNSTAPLSEATRTFEQPQDWSGSGITTLVLYVYEGDGNTGGALYVKINNSKVPLVDASTYPPGFNPGWVQYEVDLTGMNVSNVGSLTIGVEGANAQGVIYVDDIGLHAEPPQTQVLQVVGSLIEAESGTLTDPWVVSTDRPDASGGAYILCPNGSGGGDNIGDPSNGWATYTIDIPADGDYILAIRGLTEQPDNGGDDSFYLRIPGMVVNDDNLHESGFLQNNTMFRHPDGAIVWDFVKNDNAAPHADPVIFTLTAGQHELQISRREDGTGIDAITVFAVQ